VSAFFAAWHLPGMNVYLLPMVPAVAAALWKALSPKTLAAPWRYRVRSVAQAGAITALIAAVGVASVFGAHALDAYPHAWPQLMTGIAIALPLELAAGWAVGVLIGVVVSIVAYCVAFGRRCGSGARRPLPSWRRRARSPMSGPKSQKCESIGAIND
jgi:hypothetical protein